ncbi:MAG: tetratricopeptide repeat protein [Gemmataceae bacterium]
MQIPNWIACTQQAEQLFDKQQFDQAVERAEQALRLNPAAAAAQQVLGLASLERNRPREAIPQLKRALALRPDLVHSHNGLGRCHFLLGEIDRALQHFNTAIFLQPDYAFAHFNRSLIWLKQGRYREGWAEYEWRWTCGLVKRTEVPCPRWDGSPLEGRSLFLHTEQGIGDVLQFIRFLHPLKAMSSRVVLACQKPLHALLRTLPYVDEWFPVDEPGKITFDLYSPLLSLPGLLGIDEQTIPREVPYIFAEPERVERWGRRIQEVPGFKVGLCWQGSPTFKTDALRSIALEHFAALARIPSVALISLQHGLGTEQIEPNRPRMSLRIFEDLDREAAFVDRAALMQHLDLVISCDTAIAHLAGALGRPVWLLLPRGSDWRWLIDRADSPWYPTMRLFRQRTFGDWSGVFQEVAAALAVEIGGRSKERDVRASG